MAEWDEATVVEQLDAWRAAIRRTVIAMPPETRTTGPEVIAFLLGGARPHPGG